MSAVKSEDRETDSKQELVSALAAEMGKITRSQKVTKRVATRMAIMSVVQGELVGPGDFLPSEKELVQILGVSLGTVQVALRELQEVGTIVRRRGDGTRVASSDKISPTVWHFRFVSKADGSPLRITKLVPWIDEISDRGVWSEYLGEQPSYIRIRRKITLQGNIKAGAEMYFASSTVPGLRSIPDSELFLQNIRAYVEKHFGILTSGSTHIIQTVSLDDDMASIFDLPGGVGYYEIHAKAFSPTQHPVYFQRAFIAAKDCNLTF